VTEDLTPLAASYRGDGMYKPVPDDYRDLMQRLIDAAEEVSAWHAVLDGDMTNDDCKKAVSRLDDAISKASTYLEGNS
jgi:guanylate kinase